MAMAYIKLTRSQIALSLVASLLTLTPFFSSSIRPTYIYLIFNLLIIALGAEAGLLSSLLSNPNPNYSKEKPKTLDSTAKLDDGNRSSDEIRKMESRTIERCSSENVNAAMKKTVVQVIKKCASTPSIFFIGGGDCSQVEQQEQDHRHVRLGIRDNDVEQVEEEEEEEEEEDDVVGGQELFAKAEDFIGNFYKQLNMQREDSWKKIHGFYPISSLNK